MLKCICSETSLASSSESQLLRWRLAPLSKNASARTDSKRHMRFVAREHNIAWIEHRLHRHVQLSSFSLCMVYLYP